MNQQRHIVIACPNLSLDRTMRVDDLARGKVHRSAISDVRGGGKGVNVARALKCMGGAATVLGIAGGHTGAAVVGLLNDEGIDLVAVDCAGETRSCLSVLSGDSTTVFNESGPEIGAEWDLFEAETLNALTGGDVFVCSGSFPPGVPEDAAARLVAGARERGCTIICDTSGLQLRGALGMEPDVIKPNLPEALGVLEGRDEEPVEITADALERARAAAARLAATGPRTVVVSAAAAGLAYTDAGRVHTLAAPEVAVVNPIGAGDCLVAGITLELAAAHPLTEAILTGAAMAAASCETFAAGDLDSARVGELRRQLQRAQARR